MKKICGAIVITMVCCLLAQAQTQRPYAPVMVRSTMDTLMQQDESWDPAELDSFLTDFVVDRPKGLGAAELLEQLKGNGSGQEQHPVQGFRVQLVATREEAVARQVLQDARNGFAENTYLLYDNPYYKLRVGDCRTHEEADSLQQRAFSRGFSGAWIVRSQIQASPANRNPLSLTPDDSLRKEDDARWR